MNFNYSSTTDSEYTVFHFCYERPICWWNFFEYTHNTFVFALRKYEIKWAPKIYDDNQILKWWWSFSLWNKSSIKTNISLNFLSLSGRFKTRPGSTLCGTLCEIGKRDASNIGPLPRPRHLLCECRTLYHRIVRLPINVGVYLPF